MRELGEMMAIVELNWVMELKSLMGLDAILDYGINRSKGETELKSLRDSVQLEIMAMVGLLNPINLLNLINQSRMNTAKINGAIQTKFPYSLILDRQ